MYGEEKKTEMYINYCAESCPRVDARIVEWFEEALGEFESIYDSKSRNADRARIGEELKKDEQAK